MDARLYRWALFLSYVAMPAAMLLAVGLAALI